MGATPIYGFPYPGVNDSPNGPNQVQALAEAVEADLAVVHALALETHYGDGGTYASDVENTSGTTNSGAFTEVLTSGTTCVVVFVAPESGKVDVYNSGQVGNNTAGQSSIMSHEVRAGSTIGSGAVVQAAAIENGILSGNSVRCTVVTELSGLTPGATYHARQMFVNTGGTGTFANKRLTVRPAA